MARRNLIKFLRTSRANLNTQRTAVTLSTGEPYLITDEDRLAVATSGGDYQDLAKDFQTEITGFTAKTTPVDGDTLVMLDSAASGVAKKFTLTNLFSWFRGKILGTVSQTSGVPTGAIIERGSSGSSEYVKFADGTMICTKTVSLGTVGFSAAGGVFVSAIQAGGSYGVTFAAAPAVSIPAILSSTGVVWATQGAAGNTTTFPQYYLMSSGSSSSTGTSMTLTANGRWF